MIRGFPLLGGQKACGPRDELGPEITLADVSGEGRERRDATSRNGEGLEKSFLAVGQERTVHCNRQGFVDALGEAGGSKKEDGHMCQLAVFPKPKGCVEVPIADEPAPDCKCPQNPSACWDKPLSGPEGPARASTQPQLF